MKGLVYVSATQEIWTEGKLVELINRANTFNLLHSITGYLLYSQDKFMQYIEGEEADVDALYARIAKDPRHQILNCLEESFSEGRRFPNWSMNRLNQNQLVAIGMEKMILDYLYMFDGKIYPTKPHHSQTVWRMLDQLSYFRVQLRSHTD
ncbi:MAG: BLUF domain-containing protein [Bacteroidota bacterium]